MKLTSTYYRYHSWHLAVILGALVLIAACTPIRNSTDEAAPTANTGITTTASRPGTTPTGDLSATEQQLVAQAMNLVATESGVAVAELTLTKIAAVEWPDSSLGCPQPDMMYMQVITPGYQMTLTDSQGTVYEVHASSVPSAPMIVCKPAAGKATTATEANALGLSGILTGTITYRQRIALPAGSVLTVELQDASRADAPAPVLATQTITTAGENVPIAFALIYEPAQIEPRARYVARAPITIEGTLRWTTTERYAVLNEGAPTTGIELVVSPVP